MPEFCFFSSDAEGRLQVFILVLAVVHIVEISVAELAMDEEHLGIVLRFCVFKIRRHLNCPHHLRFPRFDHRQEFAGALHATKRQETALEKRLQRPETGDPSRPSHRGERLAQ